MSLGPPCFLGRYTLTEWLMSAWFIAGIISTWIGSTIWFIPTHLVELVLIVLGLTIGIAYLVRITPSPDSPVWNQTEWNMLPPSLGRPMLYILGTVVLAFMSAANVYMVVLATHAATSQSAEITLSVSSTGRDSGMLGRCLHYAVLREGAFPFMRRTCISPELFQIIHRESPLLVSGSQSPVGFRPRSLRLCTPPQKCEQNDAVGDGALQVLLEILLLVTIVCCAYIGWRMTPPNRRFHTFVLPPLGTIGLVIALLLVCRFFHVLCFSSN